MKTLLMISAFFAMANVASAMTKSEYEAIRSSFYAQIKDNYRNIDVATVMRLSKYSSLNGLKSERRFIYFILLGFHDCVGGCDGCINLENPHNAGLALAIEIMEEVFEDVEAQGIVVSRADVWAIGGRCAAEFGLPGMPGHEDYDHENSDYAESLANFVSPFPTFKSGRVDCDTAPYTSVVHDFPTGHYVHDQVMDFFAEQFGFDSNEVSF